MKPQQPQQIPWQLIILVVSILAAVYIFQAPGIDNTAVLALLGCACLIMGLISLRTQRQSGKPVPPQIIFQCVMGAVVLVIGVIETFHLELPQIVWYVLFGLLLALLLGFHWFRRRRKK